MHAQNIFAFLALAVMAMSAPILTPNAGTHSTTPLRSSNVPRLTFVADIVRKSEAKADAVDITQIGDGY